MPTPDEEEPANHAASRRVAEDQKATEYLANERTFLAWVRTSIAVISLGFVVAKFGLWLERLPGAAPSQPGHKADWSTPLGSSMMAAGAGLCLLAAWHHHRTSHDIEHGHVTPARGLVIFVGGLVAFLAAVMIVYLLLSARR